MIGQTVSHYRLLEEIGTGGMGIVYRAEDLRLGREVAIKVLPPDIDDPDTALERFEREARLASALNHPHICTIHDAGDQDGRPFIVMELLKGHSLRDLLRAGPLPAEQMLDLAVQIAEALEAAHRHGIVHRDLKPANVFVTEEGYAKVLDFGVAKLMLRRSGPSGAPTGSSPTVAADRDESATDATPGTTAYMSPEQARGEPLDQRTDLFSFGAVLYQMATGRHAFPGATPAIVFNRLLSHAPERPRTLEPSLPLGLEQIIEKALEKDRELRYQDAADLLADLRRVRRTVHRLSSSSEPGMGSSEMAWSPHKERPRPGSRARRGLVLSALLVAVVGVVASLALWTRGRPALTERDSILVADFSNTTGDPVFDGTLREALVVQLGQSPFLDVVPGERVRETLRMMTTPVDAPMTHELAREVCERQGVKAMLEGSIARLGQMYVITLDATDCRLGESIASDLVQVDSKERVLQGLGHVSSSIRARLGESLASLQKYDVRIEQATTPSLDALKAYALGVAKRASGSDIESIPFFRRAVELDPEFASAYNALSLVYGSLGETDRREEYARHAYDYRERVTARERLFIEYQFHDAVTGDELRAIEILQVWKQSYPRDYRPANALAVILNRFGHYDRAIEEAGEAQRRNPSHPFPYSNLAYAFRGANRFAEAKRTAEQAVARHNETVPTRRLLYQLALIEGDAAEAERHLAWGRNQSREFDLVGAQAQATAFDGRMGQARELYRRAVEMAEGRGFPQIALGYAAQAAWTEALYGNLAPAAAQARGILARNPSLSPRLRAASVLALAGAPEEAAPPIDLASRPQLTDTFVKTFYVPVGRAAILLARGRPDEAIDTLRSAGPYELGSVAALVPLYLRGSAYLAKRSGAEAARQFQTILDHRGVDPFSPLLPLARLGLGRSLALAGDTTESRSAYEALLRDWARADQDLPVLRAARAELTTLPPPQTARSR